MTEIILLLQKRRGKSRKGPSIKHHLLCADIHHVQQSFLPGWMAGWWFTMEAMMPRLANFPRANITRGKPQCRRRRRVSLPHLIAIHLTATVDNVLLLRFFCCSLLLHSCHQQQDSILAIPSTTATRTYTTTPPLVIPFQSNWQTKRIPAPHDKQLNVNPLFCLLLIPCYGHTVEGCNEEGVGEINFLKKRRICVLYVGFLWWG